MRAGWQTAGVDNRVGILLVVAGLALAAVGVVALAGGLGWFGRLPGDIRAGRGGVRVYIPITSMLLVSVALSVLLWVIGRLR